MSRWHEDDPEYDITKHRLVVANKSGYAAGLAGSRLPVPADVRHDGLALRAWHTGYAQGALARRVSAAQGLEVE